MSLSPTFSACARKMLAVVAVAALAYGMPASTQAALLTFGSATTISGVSDVSTLGTLNRAINLGETTDRTVNGVLFDGFAPISNSTFTTLGTNTTFTGSPAAVFSTVFTSAAAPNNTLNAAYQGLLEAQTNSFNNAGAGATLTVTLSNLTPGTPYLLQLFANDSRVTGATRTATVNGANSVVLDFNNTGADGGVGQYVIGTFVADAATQVFTVTATPAQGGAALLSALQLRVVPEPSGLALGLLGLVGVCRFIRKKKS